MSGTLSSTISSRQLSIWDCLRMDSAEREEKAGVEWPRGISERAHTERPKQDLLERIIAEANMTEAMKRVKQNKGAGGIDRMTVDELDSWMATHRDRLRQRLLDGKYRPKAVRRVDIPKDKGQTRKLGIPTVVDRVIQQAICQVLVPLYEGQFSERSYGFRPKRSAHMALEKCLDYIREDYKWVVDMDLEKFFDTVNQSKLLQLLSNTIKDGRVISLIHKFMRAGIMQEGMFEASDQGVPQGGPLSPLLGNILLNECDQELERRGHRFVRYADDLVIFCKSKRAAERVLRTTSRFLEEKLFLKVNREKTQVAYIGEVDFLGYGFYTDTQGEPQLRVSKRSFQKLKQKLKQLTGRSNGMSIAGRKGAINSVIRGWVNYFKLAKMKTRLEELDGWLRRRMRMVTWKRWKRIRTKFENLKKTALGRKQAWFLANTRNKYWYVAGSPWMSIAIPKRYFELAGYLSLSDYYAKVL